jgi:ATP-dependent DNA ligase
MKARFIEPMLLLRTDKLPEGKRWAYEIKYDGYRAIAIMTAGTVLLRSRNDKDFNLRYPAVVKALAKLPDDTVIDGEVVALDAEGRPSFNTLQNYGSSEARVFFFMFDLMVLRGVSLLTEPLSTRRALLEAEVLPKLKEPVRYSARLEASLRDLVHSVKVAGP